MKKILSRMGDGAFVEMTESELRRDLEEGTRQAAQRARVAPLSEGELNHLFDIYLIPAKFVGVELGKEIVLSLDGGTVKPKNIGVHLGRTQTVQLFERMLGYDTMELGHVDYSWKQVKPIISWEQHDLEQILLVTTIPLFYGAMPNLGLYTQPDGPVPNPADLIPQGKIAESRTAMEEAIEHAVRDMVFCASKLYESGADGINLDTTGGAGDHDFLAALKVTEILKKKYPEMCIEMGMAGEFVLGTHGEVAYQGVRLAGLYPHEQVKLAEKAGVTIFGPAITTNSSKSHAWNLSRVATFVKACVQNASIPVHVNLGMGVGAAPMVNNGPSDATSRSAKALVEICRLDGL